jgi:translation initiation factor 4A
LKKQEYKGNLYIITYISMSKKITYSKKPLMKLGLSYGTQSNNTNPVRTPPTVIHKPKEPELPKEIEIEEVEAENFDNFGIKENLLRGIYGYGFERPSRIQNIAIPPILKKKDVIAQSQAGTGKTGAFTIGVLNLIDDSLKYPQAIIMSNTRELADQINEVTKELCKYTQIKTSLCIGGIPVKENVKSLKQSQLLIGTPGRLCDLIQNKDFDLDKIAIFVIDEADELLTRDFVVQTEKIISALPHTMQICIFSATLPKDILELTEKFMTDPVMLLIKKDKLTLELVKQYFVDVDRDEYKYATIADLYNKLSINQCIIFVNSVKQAEFLRDKLTEDNHVVDVIHSKLTNSQRIEIMKRFRKAEFRVLIATDLMCRGIDVQQVSYVINYDIPYDPNNYIHRIGRSGRYGKKGIAINFLTRKDYYTMEKIEKLYSTKLTELDDPEIINSYLSK